MSANKQEPPTKTVAFRLPATVVEAIKESAKDKGITVQEYFLMQIQPGTELASLLEAERMRMLMESENIAIASNKMAEDAKRIRKSLGLSEEQFIDAATQALKFLIKDNKSEE